MKYVDAVTALHKQCVNALNTVGATCRGITNAAMPHFKPPVGTAVILYSADSSAVAAFKHTLKSYSKFICAAKALPWPQKVARNLKRYRCRYCALCRDGSHG